MSRPSQGEDILVGQPARLCVPAIPGRASLHEFDGRERAGVLPGVVLFVESVQLAVALAAVVVDVTVEADDVTRPDGLVGRERRPGQCGLQSIPPVRLDPGELVVDVVGYRAADVRVAPGETFWKSFSLSEAARLELSPSTYTSTESSCQNASESTDRLSSTTSAST